MSRSKGIVNKAWMRFFAMAHGNGFNFWQSKDIADDEVNNMNYIVEYQPPTNIVDKVTTRFSDREAAIELAHGKIDEGLWVRCFIEGSE